MLLLHTDIFAAETWALPETQRPLLGLRVAHLPAGAAVPPVVSLFCQLSPALSTDHALPRLLQPYTQQPPWHRL